MRERMVWHMPISMLVSCPIHLFLLLFSLKETRQRSLTKFSKMAMIVKLMGEEIHRDTFQSKAIKKLFLFFEKKFREIQVEFVIINI